ncbi:MAG TPA: outer membrane protein assembly factor BamE [Gammaproteobacteria bacterium]|nr:outer membrane protein assembly factor BamE [Gammaproteobacteria bacterium]
MRRAALLPFVVILALAGCYKQEIRQGNYIDDAMISKLKLGMTFAQVQYVMGPAMVKDPFHPNRWDYVRYVNPNNGDPIQNWHVIVYFADGKLAKIEQPPVINKQEQLQLPTVKDASQLPADQNDNPDTTPGSGYPPPR